MKSYSKKAILKRWVFKLCLKASVVCRALRWSGEGVPQPQGCRGEGLVAHGAELGSGGLKDVCVCGSEGA